MMNKAGQTARNYKETVPVTKMNRALTQMPGKQSKAGGKFSQAKLRPQANQENSNANLPSGIKKQSHKKKQDAQPYQKGMPYPKNTLQVINNAVSVIIDNEHSSSKEDEQSELLDFLLYGDTPENDNFVGSKNSDDDEILLEGYDDAVNSLASESMDKTEYSFVSNQHIDASVSNTAKTLGDLADIVQISAQPRSRMFKKNGQIKLSPALQLEISAIENVQSTQRGPQHFQHMCNCSYDSISPIRLQESMQQLSHPSNTHKTLLESAMNVCRDSSDYILTVQKVQQTYTSTIKSNVIYHRLIACISRNSSMLVQLFMTLCQSTAETMGATLRPLMLQNGIIFNSKQLQSFMGFINNHIADNHEQSAVPANTNALILSRIYSVGCAIENLFVSKDLLERSDSEDMKISISNRQLQRMMMPSTPISIWYLLYFVMQTPPQSAKQDINQQYFNPCRHRNKHNSAQSNASLFLDHSSCNLSELSDSFNLSFLNVSDSPMPKTHNLPSGQNRENEAILAVVIKWLSKYTLHTNAVQDTT